MEDKRQNTQISPYDKNAHIYTCQDIQLTSICVQAVNCPIFIQNTDLLMLHNIKY